MRPLPTAPPRPRIDDDDEVLPAAADTEDDDDVVVVVVLAEAEVLAVAADAAA